MKMYRILGVAMAIAVSPNLMAQDVYDIENMSSSDLNGTARYVGMGGAMNALGADISTMSNNPAGIGLFRRSDVSGSVSAVNNPNGIKFDGKEKTSFSLDNFGFVYNASDGINFGFNYLKRKNFNQNYSAYNDNLGGLSQTGELAHLNSLSLATPLVHAAGEKGLIDANNNWYSAYGNAFNMAQWGNIQEYDFNIAFNLSNRVYLGFTLGAYCMNYHSYQEYAESLTAADPTKQDFNLAADRHIHGGGVDGKFGVIVRPLVDSPFRIGLAVSTPVFYNLHTDVSYGYDTWYDPGTIDYNIRTPWKLNISMGNTFGDYLAVDAEYEYNGYGSTNLNYDDGDDWDGWGSDTYDDHAMNKELDKQLKSTHTFKIGAEAKITDGLHVRAGYNFVSSPFESNAYRDEYINSAVLDYATTTNYMNKSHINRYTCGLGYKARHFYSDFALQYTNQSGQFFAFDDYYNSVLKDAGSASYVDAKLQPTKVRLDRYQFLFTLGYKF